MKPTTMFLMIALVAAAATNLPAAPHSLTFEDRVEAQRAIEAVYWRHRIWPKENPGPKPALAQVMPDEVLRSKVDDYLKKSAALDRSWQRPLSGEQLQAELNRMARDTRDGAMLQELFHALGDDPFVIAETLVRQTLADRLVRNWQEGADGKSFDAWWSSARVELAAAPETASQPYALPEAPLSSCVNDTWSAMQLDPLPHQAQQTAVWTGSEMILFGGSSGQSFGVRYTPATDTWVSVSTGANAPATRGLHTAVWTGSRMIVWGGWNGSYLSTGGRYDPATDTWTPTSTSGSCPSGRSDHTAVWTGSKMIVWGGNNGADLATGGIYDPSSDSWTATSTGQDCPTPRSKHTAVWTGNNGSKMIVWGGVGPTPLQTGSVYNPATDTWVVTSTGGAPTSRVYHSAVWTGDFMIIWGGSGTTTFFNNGASYDPVANTWAPLPMTNAPTARNRHTAVAIAGGMIVWGGYNDLLGVRNDGARLDLNLGVWTTMSNVNAPAPRESHSAVWNGTDMIVWGGTDGAGTLYNTGGRYRTSTDTWVPTSTAIGVPAGRQAHTSIWTGSEVIVWGGANATYLNSGGRYSPATDSWTQTSVGTNVPSPRLHHTAVWTGTEMIVWGGWRETGSTYENTGGRYNPATDAWTPTFSGSGTPSARQAHSAVWTGTQMIVWGGTGTSATNTGGRYTPASDSWTATSIGANVPASRFGHAAVWTGTQMIVWGGGTAVSYLSSGGLYTPSSDTWAATSLANAPAGVTGPAAVWTGQDMLVWGGFGSVGVTANGGRYNPQADAWTATATADAPPARYLHAAVWTGLDMLVWGGSNATSPLDDGARYTPAGDSWTPLSVGANRPGARSLHSAAWTGTEMIVWGGTNGSPLQDGARYCGCASVSDYYRDADGDGYGSAADVVSSCTGVIPAGYVADGTDCDDTTPLVHPGAYEVLDGMDNQCPGDPGYGLIDELASDIRFNAAGDKTKLGWTAQLNGTAYDVARSPYRDLHAGCRIAHTAATPSYTDTEVPAPGAVFYYLVRPSGPWVGSWGKRSSGVERTVCHGCDSSADQCDDGNACSADTCSGTTCISGSSACDDGNPCTDDSCTPAQGCSHVFNTSPCDDGSSCTSNDTCHAGVCAGTLPAVANHLVISQIQLAGGTTGDEFIEIYNPTATPIGLSGLSLMYKQNGGSTWNVHVLGSGSVSAVPAHGWLLVARAAYDGSVPPDEITSLSLADSGAGQVMLFAGTSSPSGCPSSGSYIDRVGWSTANCADGTPTALPAANTSILRKPGGACGNGIDSSKNGDDFINQNPSMPRNSASPPLP